MLIKDFITKDFPVLKSSDTGAYAITLMEDLKAKHLPLLSEEGDYQSLVSEKEVMGMPDLEHALSTLAVFAPSVRVDGHWHEVLGKMSRYHLTVLPVVSERGRYLGVLTGETVLDIFSQLCHAEESGSIIVLEILPQDYVVSDIARIVESNNAHLLSLLSHRDPVTGRLIVTIKVDLEDASPLVRSFERFNYEIRYYYMEQGMVDDLLQQRMEELMRYMNI
ncbi:CBS domain-containing protein [Parabacteroides sp. Marseille-P3160]|uniref:CBS domain-containing protein n=1 Tax=Parabacteroides sp. Marseille-P3160 TaxID=1917887 RepID=UPI0009BC387D